MQLIQTLQVIFVHGSDSLSCLTPSGIFRLQTSGRKLALNNSNGVQSEILDEQTMLTSKDGDVQQ